jgi:D-3-phosphoglycerate dehydrogenase
MMLKERERFDREIRERGYEPVWADPEQFLSEAECLELVGEIDGWLAGDDRITRKVLESALPRLRVIAKWGTGIDSIDLKAAKDLGVPVLNSPGAFAHTVAEAAVHYMLSLGRFFVAVDRQMRAGQWPKPQGRELSGCTLGMIGFGAIGRRIGELGSAFGMNVLFYDPFVTAPVELFGRTAHPAGLDEIARRADHVCLACNYTPESRHLIGTEFIAKMQPSAFLINVARGPLVDEAALIAALQEGRIAGAGLDVFEQEPLAPDHPFLTMDNVVLGSHNANNGRGAVEYVHQNTLNNLSKVLG